MGFHQGEICGKLEHFVKEKIRLECCPPHPRHVELSPSAAAARFQFTVQASLTNVTYYCHNMFIKGPVDPLFDWLELVCLANKNKNCLLSYS